MSHTKPFIRYVKKYISDYKHIKNKDLHNLIPQKPKTLLLALGRGHHIAGWAIHRITQGDPKVIQARIGHRISRWPNNTG